MRNFIYRFGYKTQLLGGLIITTLANVFFSFVAFADAPPAIASNVTDVSTNVLCKVFNAAFGVIITFSVLMILWGAFTYMQAQDNSEKVTLATKTITYAVIGIVVALLAKGAPLVIANIFPNVSLSTCDSGGTFGPLV